jgi:hypothetical protein
MTGGCGCAGEADAGRTTDGADSGRGATAGGCADVGCDGMTGGGNDAGRGGMTGCCADAGRVAAGRGAMTGGAGCAEAAGDAGW